ncbi:ammonium transmembrane transporter [Desmophyllum pertusum]|uniref:Ammonium transmembrane transporter n=1 Tax=Desmophyllum pertusum TaxID=174260 RepID=A0A9W9Z2A1_9CNID|nr:ammonium transmembrane transporter [Desmophyllum pertusum]
MHGGTCLDIPKHGEPAYPLASYGHGWGSGSPSARRKSFPFNHNPSTQVNLDPVQNGTPLHNPAPAPNGQPQVIHVQNGQPQSNDNLSLDADTAF